MWYESFRKKTKTLLSGWNKLIVLGVPGLECIHCLHWKKNLENQPNRFKINNVKLVECIARRRHECIILLRMNELIPTDPFITDRRAFYSIVQKRRSTNSKASKL